MIYVGILIRMIFGKLATKARDHARRDQYHAQQSALLTGVAIGMGATCDDGLVVRKDGVAVAVEFGQSNDVIQSVSWRYHAPPPGLPRFRFKPDSREKKRSVIPWLDGAFAVTADDCVALKELWSPLRCQRLLRLLGHADVECDGETMAISLSPPKIFPALVQNGIELLLDVAAADAYATKLVQSVGTYHIGPLPYAVIPAAVELRVGYARIDERVVLQARIGIAAVPDAAAERLRALGAASIDVREGGSIVTWRDVVRDRGVITDIVDVLRRVAMHSDGVFR